MIEVKIFKKCGDLLYSLSFVSYGSVKILTSHFSRGAPLQMRLETSSRYKKGCMQQIEPNKCVLNCVEE